MTANQNIIDLIARRYSSPATDSLNNVTNSQASANVRKNSATDVAIKIPEKIDETQASSPTSPSTMLNKLSPGNIFKNIFK